ncbi:ATP-binding protein [Streptomyces sp. NL15-2K]|uniref:ATP-binding protein n=2 Tax=Streptomyces sp. NL15-2K TaxID=376149 RepID=UPI0026EF2D08|nr:ATP-binding protein [Kutzneria buriramensis]WKX16230.1 ATP-binding protein [Kutzneria buriramensis]
MPCEPSSVRRARQLVSSALCAWGMDDDLAATGELIVSELMTNTIDHTRCREAQVVVQRRLENLVRIGVADRDGNLPEMDDKPGDDADCGRGLLLVDQLSYRWGYDLLRHGKVVWAECAMEAP